MTEPAAKDNRRILIIGGGDYLGSLMTGFFLEAGYEVTVFNRLMFGLEPLRPLKSRKGFFLIREDFRNLSAVSSAVRGKDAVILLAALVGETAGNLDPYETVAVNYLVTLNLQVITTLLPVHYGGHPVEMDAFIALAERYHLRLVEDAAHALGASYRGKPVGAWGLWKKSSRDTTWSSV